MSNKKSIDRKKAEDKMLKLDMRWKKIHEIRRRWKKWNITRQEEEKLEGDMKCNRWTGED